MYMSSQWFKYSLELTLPMALQGISASNLNQVTKMFLLYMLGIPSQDPKYQFSASLPA